MEAPPRLFCCGPQRMQKNPWLTRKVAVAEFWEILLWEIAAVVRCCWMPWVERKRLVVAAIFAMPRKLATSWIHGLMI